MRKSDPGERTALPGSANNQHQSLGPLCRSLEQCPLTSLSPDTCCPAQPASSVHKEGPHPTWSAILFIPEGFFSISPLTSAHKVNCLIGVPGFESQGQLSHWSAWVRVQALLSIPASCTALGEKSDGPHGWVPTPPIGGQDGVPASSLGPDQPWLWWASGEWISGWLLSLSVKIIFLKGALHCGIEGKATRWDTGIQ